MKIVPIFWSDPTSGWVVKRMGQEMGDRRWRRSLHLGFVWGWSSIRKAPREMTQGWHCMRYLLIWWDPEPVFPPPTFQSSQKTDRQRTERGCNTVRIWDAQILSQLGDENICTISCLVLIFSKVDRKSSGWINIFHTHKQPKGESQSANNKNPPKKTSQKSQM